jgi:Flp pilus assembly protein TadB
LSFMVFISAFLIFIGIVWLVSNKNEERISFITGEGTGKQGNQLTLENLSVLFRSIFGFIFPKQLQYQAIRSQLDCSRWHKHTVEEYFTVRILCMLGPLLIGFVFYLANPIVGLLIGGGLFICGMLLPGAYLKQDIQNRTESQEDEILTFTELLFAAAGGGMAQVEALQEASKSSDGVLAELIHDALLESEAKNISRNDALRDIKRRTKVQEVKFLIEDLVISIENGTAFRKAIEDILNRMYIMKDELNSRKAQKMETKITIPIIAMLLPGLFIIALVIPAIGYFNQ